MSTQTRRSVADLAGRIAAIVGLVVCAGLLSLGGSWIVEDLADRDEWFDGIQATMAWLFVVAPAAASAVALGSFLRNGRRELLGVGLIVLLVPVGLLPAWLY